MKPSDGRLRHDQAGDGLQPVGADPVGLARGHRQGRRRRDHRHRHQRLLPGLPGLPDGRELARDRSRRGQPERHPRDDSYGHGTLVAGILAGNSGYRPATDPLRGRYAGAAPDANLISVKIADDAGNATVLDAINGIQFAVDHKAELGIRIINLSFEAGDRASYKTDPLDAAVESAWFNGIVVVAAAGNRGTGTNAVGYAPGNDPYAVTVGAVDDQATKATRDDQIATWSSRGTTQDGFAKPELYAPGAHIVANLAPGSAFTHALPVVRPRRELHPGRRHLARRADRRRRRRPDPREAPHVDARHGQGRARQHDPRDRRGRARARGAERLQRPDPGADATTPASRRAR